ncbi:hypothetical protein DFP72DRAFT_849976 [Ephemerocybe angulata]|uniref:Uncharacterized protein n=1 Tax=Ephemerocybe angulata TaxID=980116 RepID=A0A8H6HTG4_9AGAR|nr:hypothetical protein DFP72DRAFT_849976 [Tulosesus angulatus]
MHFPALHFLSIVASLAVLSRAYSDDVFEARDNVYIDELSSRTDAALSSLSTRELIAELSERLDRRKQDNNYKEKCTLCGCTRPNTDDCPKTKYGYHNWRKYCDRGWASCTKGGSRKEEGGKREEKRARKRERDATETSRAARDEARSPSRVERVLVAWKRERCHERRFERRQVNPMGRCRQEQVGEICEAERRDEPGDMVMTRRSRRQWDGGSLG